MIRRDEIRGLESLRELEERQVAEMRGLTGEAFRAAKAKFLEMFEEVGLCIVVAQKEAEHNRDSRKLRLEQFRVSQGVWGDG